MAAPLQRDSQIHPSARGVDGVSVAFFGVFGVFPPPETSKALLAWLVLFLVRVDNDSQRFQVKGEALWNGTLLVKAKKYYFTVRERRELYHCCRGAAGRLVVLLS